MMPNTDPIVDRPVVVSGLVRRVERESRVRAYVSAALHVGLGRRAAHGDAPAQGGRRVLRLGRRAGNGFGWRLRNGMLYARSAGLPVILHCEDHTLATGVVHDGVAAVARRTPRISRQRRRRGDGDGPRPRGGDGGEGPHNPRLHGPLGGSRRVLQGQGRRHRGHHAAPPDADGRARLHARRALQGQPAAQARRRPRWRRAKPCAMASSTSWRRTTRRTPRRRRSCRWRRPRRVSSATRRPSPRSTPSWSSAAGSRWHASSRR